MYNILYLSSSKITPDQDLNILVGPVALVVCLHNDINAFHLPSELNPSVNMMQVLEQKV